MRTDLKSEVNPSARRQIAEAQLGELRWINPTTAYCTCPGVANHSNKDGKRDCRVCLEGVPTVHCLHTSCEAAITSANRTLRSAIGKAELVRTRRDSSGPARPSTPVAPRRLERFRVLRADEAFAYASGTQTRTKSETSETARDNPNTCTPLRRGVG